MVKNLRLSLKNGIQDLPQCSVIITNQAKKNTKDIVDL
jgi:hypothetical protein